MTKSVPGNAISHDNMSCGTTSSGSTEAVTETSNRPGLDKFGLKSTSVEENIVKLEIAYPW